MSCISYRLLKSPYTVLDTQGTRSKKKKQSCHFQISAFHCCSVAKSCLTLCYPMNCSAPGLPVPHHILHFAQVHVHCISDPIQPSQLLSPLFPCAFSLCQHQGLFQLVGWSRQVTKYWSFSFSISPSNEYSGLISFRTDWFDLASKRLSRVFSSTAV